MKLKKAIVLLGALALTFLTLNVNSYASNSYYLMSCTKQNIPTGYYDSIDINASEESFRQTLHDVISSNYVKNSYDAVWNIDSYADADPYNEGHVQCLYTGLSIEKDSHISSGDKLYWNREHTWPKSHGFDFSDSAPYTDCHHLRASESKINIAKSNNDFGELTSDYTESYGNKYGNGVFEPNDDVKGDVARMLLYMVIRYGEYDTETFTVDNNTYTANLELVDNTNTTSISLGDGRLAKLSTILSWHYQDPVSEREIYRNNVVYMFQKNRNPFIDHPEFVEYAFRDSGTYTGNGNINYPKPDTIERTEEVLVDNIGFEESEGFTANSSNYYNQNTYKTNLNWAAHQAAPSTTGAISGSQSLRLSVAKSSNQNAQFFMLDDVYNLSRVTFKAKGNSSGYKLNVMYSLDSGLSFIDGQTYNLTTTGKTYEFVLSSNGGYDKARIGFYFTIDNSSSSYINIDDINIYRLKSAPNVEFSRENTKASLRYNYVNEYYGEEDIYYEQISSLDELTIGTEIIIGALNSNYTMASASTNNYTSIENASVDGKINPLSSSVITIGEGAIEGTISLCVGNKYLGNGTKSNNYLKSYISLSEASSWTVSMDEDTKAVSFIISDINTGSKNLRFNATSKIFSCYQSGQEDITVYIKKSGSIQKCNTTITNMNLRFGAVIEKEMYDDLLELDSNATFGIALSKDGINYKNYDCNPAIVSFENGSAISNINGNYAQWAVVIPTDSNKFETIVYARGYAKINGITYYMNESTYSVITLAEYYKNNGDSLGLSSEEVTSLGGIV